MSDAVLLRVLAAAAITAGLLRIAFAFVPWAPDLWWLELFYLAIDLLLLFGLMGVFLAYRAQIGVFGFVGFVIAEAGIASIVGPDTVAFGIDTYQAGVLVITVGLTLLAIQLLVTRAGPPWAPLCWIGSAAIGIGATAGGAPELGFVAGGVLFGLGFVGAGVAMLRTATPSSS
jgi:hypothetical protein